MNVVKFEHQELVNDLRKQLNKAKSDNAILDQKVRILEQRLKEYDERNCNIQKMNGTIMNVLNELNTNQLNVKQQQELQKVNINHYRKKLFSPKNYKFGQIVKYGTIQTLAFLTVYLGGTALISGLYNPVEYLRGLAKIKGKQIDNSLQFDPFFQKHVLFSMLDFFGLSDKLVSQIQYYFSYIFFFQRTEIQDKKTKLENSNYFSEDTKKLMNERQD